MPSHIHYLDMNFTLYFDHSLQTVGVNVSNLAFVRRGVESLIIGKFRVSSPFVC